MFKKISSVISGALVIALSTALIIFSPVAAYAQTFKDVKPTNTYYKQIEEMASLKITSGYGDKTYRPSVNVSRAVMFEFMYRAAGSPKVATPKASPFIDVSVKHSSYKAIIWANSKKISTGWNTSKGREFRPNKTVNRAETAALLMRASGDKAPAASSKAFTDVKTTTTHSAAISWAKQKGVSTGYKNGTYKPTTVVKRDMAAGFIVNWVKYENSKKTKNTGSSSSSYKTTANVNFRTGAGTQYKVIKYLPKNTTVTGTGRVSGSWKEVKWSGKTGWVFDSYLNLTIPAVKIPAVVAPTKPSPKPTPPPVIEAPKPENKPEPIEKPTLTPDPSIPATNPLTPTAVSSFDVYGAGFGHGVGMSQYGAEQMARDGKTSKQILEHYYNPAKLEYSSSYANSDIRVQLIISSYQKITPVNGSMTLKIGSKDYTTSKPVDMKFVNGVREYVIDGKTVKSSSDNDTLTWTDMVKVDRANDSSKAVNYKYGLMRISTIGSQINISNVLKVNTEYLYGLAEMPASWSQASLQSQAIAGRTYAMRNMSSIKPACDCNVYDEVKSQKFTGYDVVSSWKGDNWQKAVDATVHKSGSTIVSAGVMKYNGSLIDAVYSSSSAGGKTQSGKDMWGGNTTYLQSRSDKASTTSLNPNRSWTVNVSQSKMNSIFGLKNITKVDVVKNSSGYAQTVIATDKDGKTKSISGAQFRNGAGLKSTGVSAVVNN